MRVFATFQLPVYLSMRSAQASRHFSKEHGSAIVETAMSISILLTMLIGVMEGAFAIYSYHFISDAAREGTRYAIVRGSSAGSACTTYASSACIASTANIQSYIQNLGFPGINPNNMTVNVSWVGYPAGTTCTPSNTCNNPGNQVTVTVTYSFPVLVPFIPSHTYAMSSTAAMIIAQ
jgi:Flp pilus assembly protein TadG